MIEEDGTSLEQKGEAMLLLKCMRSFEFISSCTWCFFLSITHEVSQALQRSDQDIVNGMKLVKMSKQKLQTIRASGWDFCSMKFHCCVNIMKLSSQIWMITFKKSKRNSEKVSNLHYFQVQFFYQVIDRRIQKLNNHFISEYWVASLRSLFKPKR